MALKLFNTASRKKEVFTAINPPNVGLYCCGPTVYWYQHIGNLRTYIFEDILKRVLEFNNFKVKHVINVTDVGHLTSDADEGEDKFMKALRREGLSITKESMLKLADKYFREFRTDFKRLNIIEPDVWCKATEHIQEMIELIKRIEGNKFTYETSVGLIFDSGKFKRYADFGRLNLQQLEEGHRGKKDEERKSPSDFALWINNQPTHVMQWDSPWGRGFPGWHIECSAMSMKYLGEQFDVHCGGKEHVQVHHTNEIAQSEAATNKHPWVKYWLHAEWLVVPEGKMAKSKGNFTRVVDLIEKGYDPLAFRYLCLTAQYRTALTFSWESLDNAQKSYYRLKNVIDSFQDKCKEEEKTNDKVIEKYSSEFENAINDDLNMPQGMAVLWGVIRDVKLNNKSKIILVEKFDAVLGLKLLEKQEISIPSTVLELAKKREQARKENNWELADKCREEIKILGFLISDQKEGFKISKLNAS